jgi:hypothetical protein
MAHWMDEIRDYRPAAAARQLKNLIAGIKKIYRQKQKAASHLSSPNVIGTNQQRPSPCLSRRDRASSCNLSE